MSPHHAISSSQFTDHGVLLPLLDSAAELESEEEGGKLPQVLKGKIVATLFYEPSTRTRLSFEVAALKLGAQVISCESAGQFSSAAKGETLADTMQMMNGYADALVIRHPEKGSAAECAAHATIPVINAGDGAGEHPTQALLDLYTIKKELGTLDNLTVTMVGDLLNGRTVHSLLPLLATFKNMTVHLVAPAALQLPRELKDTYAKKVTIHEHNSLEKVLPVSDVFYMTRVQKERFAQEADYLAVKDAFILDLPTVKKMKESAIIMHPLPRVNEIHPDIDSNPRAAYFRQAKNGVYMRMALLKHLLTNA
jgi:aspartate carbamoyltransferase catalytic subunit